MIPHPGAIPRMMAGRMNWLRCCQGFTEKAVNCNGGAQPNQIEGSTMTRVAFQNWGTDRPTIAALRVV